MNNRISLLVAAFVVVGCAATPAPKSSRPPVYTAQERTNMHVCVAMTDTAHTIADGKIKGKSAQELKSVRVAGAASELYLATVDKVFEDKFTHSFDYAVAFFNECALNMAKIPQARVDFASYCNTNSMLAVRAYEYKALGLPKERVHTELAGFAAETTKRIVDQVYAGSKDRFTAAYREWDSCMDPISGK